MDRPGEYQVRYGEGYPTCGSWLEVTFAFAPDTKKKIKGPFKPYITGTTCLIYRQILVQHVKTYFFLMNYQYSSN